ncbi:protein P21-like [Carya illinoinensis]|uniref:protein P21-like n=1 Tax=Carya illinoinensis TaxID=32201 RepID=UPI001C72709D|nr:protein P21-like [Carya illinoinensis]
MIFYKNLSTFSFLYALCFSLAHAATFVITNNCPYTVWAGAVPGGGMRLNPRGGIWNLDVSAGTKGARIWPRTGCSFDEAGRGRCQTGDCDGLLQCQAYGAPPNTLAEYALNQTVRCDNWEKATATRRKLYPAAYSISFESGPPHVGILASTMCNNGGLLRCQAFGAPPNTLAEYAQNQFIYLDFFNISLVDGFNVLMKFSLISNGCTRGISCIADINGQCPDELNAPDGCNNPCTVFKTDQYCCNSGSCGLTDFSKFFKDRCPDAYSYPKDDQTNTFTCNGGTNY